MALFETLLVAVVIAFFSLASILLHYEALRALSYVLPRLSVKPRQKALFVVCSALVAHLLEVLLFAVAFWSFFELDTPASGESVSFATSLYISVESYTSLGTSSGFPQGLMRMLAGVEAVVGLILIGWTASYTYLVMSEFWPDIGSKD